jgi:hypothetical protein
VIPDLEVQPCGRTGRTGDALRTDPRSAVCLKVEDKTLIWSQPLPDGRPAVWKLYRHRRSPWSDRCALRTCRAQREFLGLCHLDSHGVACSQPLFWATGRNRDTGHYELLVTREVPKSLDMQTRMAERLRRPPLDLAPMFALVAAQHRAGLFHGALLARNILLSGGAFFLIDLPRCRVFPRPLAGTLPGLFDLRLLMQSLTRFAPDEDLVRGLAGYPNLPQPAAAWVADLRARPWTNRRVKARYLLCCLQAACARARGAG